MNKEVMIRIMNFDKWERFFTGDYTYGVRLWMEQLRNYAKSQLIRTEADNALKASSVSAEQAKLFAAELIDKDYWIEITKPPK
jgi:hypothetical protein